MGEVAGMSEQSQPTEEQLLAAQKAGANSRAAQVIYRLPLQENNPHPPGTLLHAHYHHGYEMERSARDCSVISVLSQCVASQPR